MTNYYPLVGDVQFDYITCSYDGSGNLLIAKFYQGGSGGNLVMTLTMTYDGSNNLLTVTKTE